MRKFSVHFEPQIATGCAEMKRPSFNLLLTYLVTSSLAISTFACGSSSDGDDGGSAGGAGSHAGDAGDGASAGVGYGGLLDSSDGGADSASGAAGAAHAGSGSTTPTSPVGDYSIASTAKGSCALDGSGVIQCWGYLPDSWIIPSGAFVELHASIDYVCAVRADRTVTCFDPPPPGNPSGVAARVPNGKVQTLTVNRGTVCGTDETGKAFCDSAYAGLEVPPDETLSQLSAGFFFACGVRSGDGTLTCWGNVSGDVDCKIPVTGQLAAPTGAFVAISSSFYSSCALAKNGTVACWGAGKPTDDPAALCAGEPYNFGQSAPPAGNFSSLSVGTNHTCGVKTDGTIACWGAGTTTTDCSGSQTECGQSQPAAGKFSQISVGNYHSCAMTADRKVKCWGYPGEGAGDGRLTPPAAFQ
jgi:Regulator of chromosome condensation (RCC1) repeat